MTLVVAAAFLFLSLSQPGLAQQSYFNTQDDCTNNCKHGSCSDATLASNTVWLCICNYGFTGYACDQEPDSSGAPVPAPSTAPVIAPSTAAQSTLDCGPGAHALDANNNIVCNCQGTGRSGANCEVGAPAPAPASGTPATSHTASAPAPAANFSATSSPAKAPSPSAVPPSNSLKTGPCPQGSLGCVPCPNGVYCLNFGECPGVNPQCTCPSYGSQLWGGPNCDVLVGSTPATSSNNSPNSQTTSGNNIPAPPSGSHISGVGVAVIVILVLVIVAGIIGGFAFWKARGRTSKFDRFADQPEIFRGATTNL